MSDADAGKDEIELLAVPRQLDGRARRPPRVMIDQQAEPVPVRTISVRRSQSRWRCGRPRRRRPAPSGRPSWCAALEEQGVPDGARPSDDRARSRKASTMSRPPPAQPTKSAFASRCRSPPRRSIIASDREAALTRATACSGCRRMVRSTRPGCGRRRGRMASRPPRSSDRLTSRSTVELEVAGDLRIGLGRHLGIGVLTCSASGAAQAVNTPPPGTRRPRPDRKRCPCPPWPARARRPRSQRPRRPGFERSPVSRRWRRPARRRRPCPGGLDREPPCVAIRTTSIVPERADAPARRARSVSSVRSGGSCSRPSTRLRDQLGQVGYDVGIDLGRVGVVGEVGALEATTSSRPKAREHRENLGQAPLLVVR